MATEVPSLLMVYKGWDDYQISLLRAIAPLSPAQLAWRPAPHLSSVGEIARHIIRARLEWLQRILPPENAEVAAWAPEETIEEQSSELVKGLEASWQIIEDVLTRWSIVDLAQMYLDTYQGKTYALSRQWMIWHVIAHDLHHGGELAVLLGMQGIALPELGDEGGHLSERAPLAEPS